MADQIKRRTSGFAVFAVVMLTLFVGLGVWQLQRRAETHALIAVLNERLAAAPMPLPDPSQWHALTAERDEFRRVSFSATYESRLDAMVYSSGTGMRDDISVPGTWAFLPARLPTGETLAVNAGFVPNTTQDRGRQDRAVAQLITNKPVMLTGYLRFPVSAGWFAPDVEHAKRLWFTRDHLAMAQALGWDRVAPFYIDLEAPVPPGGIPKPGPLQVHLRDDQLKFAITCFSLAGLVLIALAVWLRRRRGIEGMA
ncbi:SURF1 family protein [Bradyrhizobium neotropicale]|uniref:SURF1-like protein n=1 Tax=Bradyrhizobium neotropicale TaxID=1497615 RepID=A0A176YN92_9BRAD|nr:SURF1 family cytochrome oxidase biogenesis protein [Bradyrhizobium neotropicale]OAF08645.1 surfeit 1 protein [Bradyrhizobium neotropicale]